MITLKRFLTLVWNVGIFNYVTTPTQGGQLTLNTRPNAITVVNYNGYQSSKPLAGVWVLSRGTGIGAMVVRQPDAIRQPTLPPIIVQPTAPVKGTPGSGGVGGLD